MFWWKITCLFCFEWMLNSKTCNKAVTWTGIMLDIIVKIKPWRFIGCVDSFWCSGAECRCRLTEMGHLLHNPICRTCLSEKMAAPHFSGKGVKFVFTFKCFLARVVAIRVIGGWHNLFSGIHRCGFVAVLLNIKKFLHFVNREIQNRQ